jgi:hypothetical protein
MNDISIARTDANGNTLSIMKVPLTYAAKDKMLSRVDADPAINRQTAITLPRMSFELTNLSYAGERMLNRSQRHPVKDPTNANKLKTQYTPVPYDLTFQLHIYVKNQEDGTKIIEQILPFFTPDWTVTVNLIPEMNESRDIPITLMNIEGPVDNYSGPMTNDRQMITWTLTFVMKTFFYGPITPKPIIKVANTTFYYAVGEALGGFTVTPGLDANGNPTTLAANSIPIANIEVDDDFGFVIEQNGSNIALDGE